MSVLDTSLCGIILLMIVYIYYQEQYCREILTQYFKIRVEVDMKQDEIFKLQQKIIRLAKKVIN